MEARDRAKGATAIREGVKAIESRSASALKTHATTLQNLGDRYTTQNDPWAYTYKGYSQFFLFSRSFMVQKPEEHYLQLSVRNFRDAYEFGTDTNYETEKALIEMLRSDLSVFHKDLLNLKKAMPAYAATVDEWQKLLDDMR